MCGATTYVEGGKPFSGVLAHPPSNTGAFQNLSIHDAMPAPSGSKAVPQFYADAAVVAYKRAASDVPLESLHPKITASGGSPDFALLADGDLEKTTGLPIPGQGESAWIQYEFSEPATIRAITFVTKDPGGLEAVFAGIAPPDKALEASDDGQNFRLVTALPGGDSPEHTVSFPAVTAKYFRVTFKRTPPPPVPFWAQGIDPASVGFKASEAPNNV